MTAPKLDAQDKARLCAMVRDQGYTVRETARHFEVSERTAHRVLAADPPARADVLRDRVRTLMRAALADMNDEALLCVEDAIDEYMTERTRREAAE